MNKQRINPVRNNPALVYPHRMWRPVIKTAIIVQDLANDAIIATAVLAMLAWLIWMPITAAVFTALAVLSIGFRLLISYLNGVGVFGGR